MSLKRLLPLLAIVLLCLTAWPAPGRVAAQTAPTINSITPDIIMGGVTTTVLVEGTDFSFNALVSLVEYPLASLPVNWISASVLLVEIPASVPPGNYNLKVTNPDPWGVQWATRPITILAPTPTIEPTTTPTITPTPAPTSYARPLLVVQSYGASSAYIVPGSFPDFEMTLINAGQMQATNIVVTFPTGDFAPRTTGGVQALGTLDPGSTKRFFQPLTADPSIYAKLIATLEVKVTYTDQSGTVYNESFTLTFPVFQPTASGPGSTATPTPTPTPQNVQRPQLLITGYRTDVVQLQPGGRFTLFLEVQNLGNATARRITLIAGGGSASSGGNGGTPGPGGGVSGSGGDFTNFAPVNSSNIQSLGDLLASGLVSPNQSFVVNTSTNPGVYPMKFSFIYADDKGNTYTDDQVITLFVYRPPQLEVSFYSEVGTLFTNQPSLLPIQIVNFGKNTAVLGNAKVMVLDETAAQFSNNVALLGAIASGDLSQLDATIIPLRPGPLELLVVMDYTDDFNAPASITRTITVEVLDSGPIDGGGGDGGGVIDGGGGGGGGEVFPPPVEESLWDKFWRFLMGLLGLDSSAPNNGAPSEFPSEMPTDTVPVVPPKG